MVFRMKYRSAANTPEITLNRVWVNDHGNVEFRRQPAGSKSARASAENGRPVLFMTNSPGKYTPKLINRTHKILIVCLVMIVIIE